MNEKIVPAIRKRTRADGTVVDYEYTRIYKFKSHVQPDGSLFILTPEQVAEIKRLRNELAVPNKKLQEMFNCSYTTIKKALNKK